MGAMRSESSQISDFGGELTATSPIFEAADPQKNAEVRPEVSMAQDFRLMFRCFGGSFKHR